MGKACGDGDIENQPGYVNSLLTRLPEFHLLNSAEGVIELRGSVRRVGLAYEVRADLLATAEGAVLTVRHPVAPSYTETMRVVAATAEIAVGQLTPGAVRLAQAAFTLVELAIGVVIAAEVSGVSPDALFDSVVPPVLPF